MMAFSLAEAKAKEACRNKEVRRTKMQILMTLISVFFVTSLALGQADAGSNSGKKVKAKNKETKLLNAPEPQPLWKYETGG